MANQPEQVPKGQISYNTGAKPATIKPVKPVKSQNMKRIKHDAKLQQHNEKMKGV